MSAADRIEAAVTGWRCGHDKNDDLRRINRLYAIAAELRGAPALTEAERAFFEVALAVAEAYIGVANTDEYGPKLMAMIILYRRLKGQTDIPGEVIAAGRALRTERTPS